MSNAVLELCAFVVREGWEQREDEGDYPRRLAQKAMTEADALRARAEKAEAALGALTAWTHEYGAALKPPGANTYGEGMRDAKDQVAAILRGTT